MCDSVDVIRRGWAGVVRAWERKNLIVAGMFRAQSTRPIPPRYSHRTIEDGIGHNVQLVAPQAFAHAVLKVGRDG
jgi:hypothetical protein